MYRSTVKMPANRCAFHDNNLITYFCKYQQCLLPLCKLCLPIHRKQHSNKMSPIDLQPIEEELWSAQNRISGELSRLEQAYFQIINKISQSNQLHTQMKKVIATQREQVVRSIHLYYDSLCVQIDKNCKRKEIWLQQISTHYNNIKMEMNTLRQKLHNQQHLRTVIMWNRLKPDIIISDILRQVNKQFSPPSMVPCDVQQLIGAMSKNQKMTILDLHGDMGFNNLEKVLFTLRYGQEQSILSVKQGGISVMTRQSKVSTRMLPMSKSTDRL